MSVASPIQCIRILNPSSTTNSSSFRFSTTKPCVLVIRCSQAEGPLRRPSAPPTLPEPSPPQKPVPPTPSSPPQKSVAVDGKGVTTVEFQRQKAKELQDYFKQKKLEII
ncbi:light-harvesting complex-like protein OHP2, chloroplastic [Raphanus sativus]|uniref:Light-harvesting complex-like protein OHP2, chloroplastic n=1 Tax=Raphanus sativus TaxID=3726 RepID=A0A6J0KNQ5_RAPSA|nr:light-harvesting complex-like protein OHP2, chloroplastic [Raphanus sativus]XP_056847546.1 light-harvesting complex-like protein OHP2, chloroplastic [Raphanus sativus]